MVFLWFSLWFSSAGTHWDTAYFTVAWKPSVLLVSLGGQHGPGAPLDDCLLVNQKKYDEYSYGISMEYLWIMVII